MNPSGQQSEKTFDLESWRAWFVDFLVRILLIALPLSMLVTIPVFLEQKNYGLIVLAFTLIAALIVQLFGWPRTDIHKRYLWLFIVYVLAISLFVALGPNYARSAWLVFCVVMTSLLFGARAAGLAVIFNAVLLLAFWFLISPDAPAWRDIHDNGLKVWLMFAANTSILSIGAGLPVGFLIERLDKAFENEKDISRKLMEDGEQLQEALKKLQDQMSERQKAEEALRESEEKYRLLANNVMDTIWLMSLDDLRYTYVSPSIERLSGYTAEEAMEFSLQDVLTQASLDLAFEFLEKELAREAADPDLYRTFTYEFEQYHKNGSTVWSESSMKFIRDGQGRPVSVLGVSRDISQRRDLQLQLEQAQKMEAVGVLASGIAHDFNNILQAIGGATQLIESRTGLDEFVLKHISEIDAAVARAADLVQRLLTSSRKVEPELKPLQVADEVRQSIEMLKRIIPKMIEIETVISDDVGRINADAGQFNQVMLNLGTNARDAMPDGGKLMIRAKIAVLDTEFCSHHLDATPGDYVKLSVSDSGRGMDDKTIEKIFTPFFSTKDVGRGAGLGLSVVYGIVKNHHGFITCDSEPGRGATFTIYWPATSDIRSGIKPEDVGKKPELVGSEQILLVDDEKMLIDAAGDLFEVFGYSVVKAFSGEEALSIYMEKRDEIDLIVMDIGMPGIGGLKALEELVAFDPEVRVVIASGYSSESSVQEALRAGASGFIRKPYKINDALLTIREIQDAEIK